MRRFRLYLVCGVALGLLALAVAVGRVTTSREAEPALQGRAKAPAPEPEAQPGAAPEPVARVSRSKGSLDWIFFFRAGDTLSRMRDGAMLGVVVRTEKTHSFADGSVGPAYVVRLTDKTEALFDADELERSARIESINPPTGPPASLRLR